MFAPAIGGREGPSPPERSSSAPRVRSRCGGPMSAFLDAAARHQPTADVRRLGPIAAIPLILALLAVGVASAERPSAVQRLSADDAARSGSLIRLLPHALGGTTLLEVQPAGEATLLAVSADGRQAAWQTESAMPRARSPSRAVTAHRFASSCPDCSPPDSRPMAPGSRSSTGAVRSGRSTPPPATPGRLPTDRSLARRSSPATAR